MDVLSVLIGIGAASAAWSVSLAVGRRARRKPRTCIAEWTEGRMDWSCSAVAHPACRSQRCRRHCKSDLCGCLTLDPAEAEVLKELRAVTKEPRP